MLAGCAEKVQAEKRDAMPAMVGQVQEKTQGTEVPWALGRGA